MSTQVGDFPVEHCLLVIGHFLRPGQLVRHLRLPVVVDEDICRLNIAKLFASGVEKGGSFKQNKYQVPEFFILEVFEVGLDPIFDFLTQEIGVIIVAYLADAIRAAQFSASELVAEG
jgi:hypothetical protein